MLFFAILFVTTAISSTNAQIVSTYIDETELEFKVKLIDEFFRRFNYETDYKGTYMETLADSMRNDTVMKRKNLITLFNRETFENKNKELDSISSNFLDYVIKNNKKIHYEDSTWYAEAKSSYLMNGKSYPIRFFLKTEHVRNDIYKWVITDVKADLFSHLTDSINSKISILSGAHGTSFITLPETINLNAKNVRAFFCKDYKASPLSLFEYLVTTGKIKIRDITKVIYHFQLDDYNFTVERFEREKTYNKGWLISKITKNNKL